MNDKKVQQNITKWIIGIAFVCILIYLAIKNIAFVGQAILTVIDLFFPLILGFAFALILNVPMSFLESHLFTKGKKAILVKIRRPLAFILSVILILGIFVGVVWLVIPEFVGAIRIIAKNVINLINELSRNAKENSAIQNYLQKIAETIEWENLLKYTESWLKNQGGDIVDSAIGTISTFAGGVVNFFLALVFSVYILFGKETLKGQCKRLIKVWIPEKIGGIILHSSKVAGGIFRNFVSGQTLEALILGSLCTIGMFILRIPYAPMVGALVGVTALIPVVGAFAALLVGAFMIVTISPVKTIIFIVFFLVLQQFEGNIIYPKVMGNKINLPAIWILVAVTVGGSIGGAIGMLLAVPFTSTIYELVREATVAKEQSKKKTEEIDATVDPDDTASVEQ